MITGFLAGKRFFLGHAPLWVILSFFVMATGRGRTVSLHYQPTNSLKGQGTVKFAQFRYQPSDEHPVRPRQVETNPLARTGLFLSEPIGVVFSNALILELSRSG